MHDLRRNQDLMAEANELLRKATNGVSCLQPPNQSQPGFGATGQNNRQVINSVDQLYQATIVNKQSHCYEFAKTSQFPCRNNLKQDNCNATTFAYGAFKGGVW